MYEGFDKDNSEATARLEMKDPLTTIAGSMKAVMDDLIKTGVITRQNHDGKSKVTKITSDMGVSMSDLASAKAFTFDDKTIFTVNPVYKVADTTKTKDIKSYFYGNSNVIELQENLRTGADELATFHNRIGGIAFLSGILWSNWTSGKLTKAGAIIGGIKLDDLLNTVVGTESTAIDTKTPRRAHRAAAFLWYLSVGMLGEVGVPVLNFFPYNNIYVCSIGIDNTKSSKIHKMCSTWFRNSNDAKLLNFVIPGYEVALRGISPVSRLVCAAYVSIIISKFSVKKEDDFLAGLRNYTQLLTSCGLSPEDAITIIDSMLDNKKIRSKAASDQPIINLLSKLGVTTASDLLNTKYNLQLLK